MIARDSFFFGVREPVGRRWQNPSRRNRRRQECSPLVHPELEFPAQSKDLRPDQPRVCGSTALHPHSEQRWRQESSPLRKKPMVSSRRFRLRTVFGQRPHSSATKSRTVRNSWRGTVREGLRRQKIPPTIRRHGNNRPETKKSSRCRLPRHELSPPGGL